MVISTCPDPRSAAPATPPLPAASAIQTGTPGESQGAADVEAKRTAVGSPRGTLGTLPAAALAYLSRRVLARTARAHPHRVARTRSRAAYRGWRHDELRHQLFTHFDVGHIAGRDALDFGCGTGELCRLLCERGAASVTGADISPQAITHAAAANEDEPACSSHRPRFLLVDGARLPLADGSVDLVCCFDVLEHLSDPAAALGEWRRVLRPDGRVWIWWSPWRGPYGHHLDSLLPLPWVHLLFAERTLFEAAARVYDSPQFIPRVWDLEDERGTRKPNKWRTTRRFDPFLNRLTRRGFERMVAGAGMRVLRRETHGFRGSLLGRCTRVLLPVPTLGECVVSFYIYELG